MKKFYSLFFILCMSFCAHAQTYNPSLPSEFGPQGNWDGYRFSNSLMSPCQSGVQIQTPSSSQMFFTFTLSQTYRQTAASVFNASGQAVRILWSRRSYLAGTYCEGWDGNDDFGNPVTTGGPFTVKLRANNITHSWYMIGNTEPDWYSYENIDSCTRNSPFAIAFVGNRGYIPGGFTEGGDDLCSFTENAPSNFQHVNRYLNGKSGTPYTQDIASDGNYIYLVVGSQSNTSTTQYVQRFSQSGQPLSIPGGTLLSSLTSATYTSDLLNTAANAIAYNPNMTVLDYGSFITGIAANSTMIATAHGKPYNGNSAANAATVSVWNSSTGALLNSVTGIPNPQRMAFDAAGDLWVISGNSQADTLYEVTNPGGSYAVSTPITGLLNPVSVAGDPVSGDILVADGGTHQQILEFNTSSHAQVTSGTVGVLGGYCPTSGCNANIDPNGHTAAGTTLWLDPNVFNTAGTGININSIGTFTPFLSYAVVDEHGGLWVYDWSASRLLHFTRASATSPWVYQNRQVYMGTSNKVYGGLLRSDPTRVFQGVAGWLEFKVDYTKTIVPGDPEAAGGNMAWSLVRNWMPAVYAAAGYSTATFGTGTYAPDLTNVVTLPNGNVFGVSTNGEYMLPSSGILGYKAAAPPASNIQIDNAGHYCDVYSGSTVQNYQASISSYDANGFPTWGAGVALSGSATGMVAANGDPYFTSSNIPNACASLDGTWVFGTATANTSVAVTATAFRQGTAQAGHTTYMARMSPQKDIQFWTGDGAVPSRALAAGHDGITVEPIPGTNDMVGLWNGNNAPWSSNYFLYGTDGMLKGQWGWQTGTGWGVNQTALDTQVGFSTTGLGLPLVPGHIADPSVMWSAPLPGSNGYVITTGDEGYRKALHLWIVNGLNTEIVLTGTSTLGNTITIQ